MNTKEIYDKFKSMHPDLFKLNPKVLIDEKIEESNSDNEEIIKYNSPILEIAIHHPFIFDNRLIPESFDSIEIKNVILGSFPKEFPSENAALPYEEWYSPKNYEAFVTKNLDLIRQKLNSPRMTEEEALDALTGDFIKHKTWCKKLRTERLKESKKEVAFFSKLLLQTKKAYEISDIKQLSENKGWGYAVTATMILKNRPLIVGFNWGMDSKWLSEGNEYGRQANYPMRIFESNYDEMGSLKGAIPYFHDYFSEALIGMQTNFCFFRSEKENQISAKDLELSSPLFDEYLDYSSPSIIISFSIKLKNY